MHESLRSSLRIQANDTDVAVHRTRSIGLMCEDTSAAQAWRQRLLDEGLAVCDWPWPDVRWHAASAPLPDALVLHLARGVTESLGRLRESTAAWPGLPVVVVGHGLRELDQVLALEMGADDVVDATLGAAVTAARLRALWRRSAAGRTAAAPEALHFGDLSLRHRERCVWLRGQALGLTEGEFELLWRLAVQAGQAVPRQVLLRELRGFSNDGPDRSIDSRVYRLRAKLGDALGDRQAGAQRIRTIRNCGYLFSPLPA